MARQDSNRTASAKHRTLEHRTLEHRTARAVKRGAVGITRSGRPR